LKVEYKPRERAIEGWNRVNFKAIRFGKKHLLALVAVVATSLSISAPAFAATSSSIPVKLNIQSGGLTLSVESTVETQGVSLGTNVAYGTGGNATGTFAFIVDDARGETTPSGWHVNAQVGNFNGPSNATIPGSALTGVAGNIKTLAGNSGAPQPTQPKALDQSGSVLVANAGNGAGRYSADLGLTLAIPQYARPGAYSATLTVSVIAGP
jgi:hypothetical protein